jgi:sorbitol-6-phosphate 2-dehydrogenase
VGLGVDVTDESQVEAGMAGVVERLGSLDILVNNAGVLRSAFIADFEQKDWDFVIKVNLTGAFLCIKHASRHMIERKSGSIVVISSRSGKTGGKWNHAYCSSKFGVIGLTQCVALDLAEHGIRCNAVCPGNVLDSPLWDDLAVQYSKKLNMPPEQVREHYAKRVPLGRGCTYDDVLKAIIFLAGDEAAYITGQALNVTGGEIRH